MFNIKILYNLLVLLIFVFLSLPASASSSKSIYEIADSMGVSVTEAKDIFELTYSVIKEVQNNISSIASNSYSHDQKVADSGLINSTIHTFFSSRNVPVEVSSLNGESIRRTIYNYLHRLANFSKNGTYESVKLQFGKKVHFENVYRDSSGINLDVEVFQLFAGCKATYEGRHCYSDVTKKSFAVTINNSQKVSIDSISVKETMKVDDSNISF